MAGLELTRFDCLPIHLLDEIYEAEAEGHIIEDFFSVTVRRARLLRRIEAWSPRTARLFAADCAEHVLPIYDTQLRHSDSLREIIRAARDHAEGWIDLRGLKEAWREADDISSEAGTSAVASAVKACAAPTIRSTTLAVTMALDGVSQFAVKGMPEGEAKKEAASEAFRAELAWESRRLAEYLYPQEGRKV